MSKIQLDFKKFKHLKSDKDSTTLRHVDGHELKIARNGLAPEFKAQLDALSKVSKDDETPLQQDEIAHKAKGGPVPSDGMNMPMSETAMYADGSTWIGGTGGSSGQSPAPSSPSDTNGQKTPEERKKESSDWEKGSGRSVPTGQSPSFEDIKKGWWAKGGKINMDGGGQVPVPSTPTDEQTASQTVSKKAATTYGGAGSTSPLTTGDWSHIWRAEGGSVDSNKLEIEGHKYHVQDSGNGAGYRLHHQSPKGEYKTTGPFQSPKHALEYAKAQHLTTDKYAEGGGVKPPENVIDYSKFKRQQPPAGGTLDYSKIREEKKEMNRQEPPQRKKRMAEGGTCESCGGPIHRKMYADPDQPVSQDDSAPFAPGVSAAPISSEDIGGVQGVVPKLPDSDPRSSDMAAKRKEYNDIVAGHKALENWSPNPEDLSSISAIKRAQFGPNGEPPESGLDPQVAQQVEKERLSKPTTSLATWIRTMRDQIKVNSPSRTRMHHSRLNHKHNRKAWADTKVRSMKKPTSKKSSSVMSLRRDSKP